MAEFTMVYNASGCYKVWSFDSISDIEEYIQGYLSVTQWTEDWHPDGLSVLRNNKNAECEVLMASMINTSIHLHKRPRFSDLRLEKISKLIWDLNMKINGFEMVDIADLEAQDAVIIDMSDDGEPEVTSDNRA
jgi:hypothetical protein